MCGVIVVDAESFRSTWHGRDAYVHDHCLRCLHNYALFYQLLGSNLFTHCNVYAILREATSETYGPRVYLLSYKFSIYFYLHFLLSNLLHKNTKNIYLIILSLLDLTFASYREGIDNPFIVLVARFLFVCVGAWDLGGASYWIDTLVLKTEGNTYATLLHHPFLFKGKTNSCSRGSKKDFWRRCRGVYAQVKTYQVPITNSYPSHYIICHLPLVFLSPTSPLSLYSPSLSVRLFFARLSFAMPESGEVIANEGNNNNMGNFDVFNDFFSRSDLHVWVVW